MKAETVNKISIAEYIAISQEQNQKYEYHDGNIFAMAGGSINHGVIGSNLLDEIGSRLKSKKSNCFPLNSDVRLHIKTRNKILYPDVMVVCGEIERSETEKESIINPTVIIEVLSDTTEGYDRGDKYYFYQQISSLKEYILVAQDKKQVDVFRRGNENMWRFTRYEAVDQTLKIESIDVAIPFELIYRNVEFGV